MIVRLHNLSARVPVLADAPVVAELISLCEYAEMEGMAGEENVQKRWQAMGFNLSTDAWVIVSHKGLLVGYVDVRRGLTALDTSEYLMTVCVHPEFRERGVETLLIWLAEERARQLMYSEGTSRRVTLRTLINTSDSAACALFQHEGYTCTRRIWRVTIGIDELSHPSHEQGQLKIDLMLDGDDLLTVAPQSAHAGSYNARPYEVYEKVLYSVSGRHTESVFALNTAGD